MFFAGTNFLLARRTVEPQFCEWHSINFMHIVFRQIPVALACALFCSPLTGLALTTNLVPSADTSIRNNTPDSNYGGLTSLLLGRAVTGAVVNRGLIRFDVADRVPAGATITAVSLQVTLTLDPTPAANFGLHRVLREWGEGDKSTPPNFGGAPATANEATWNSRLHGAAAWGAPGGQSGVDFVADSSATTVLGGVGGQFSSAEMLADVELWRNNAGTNFGWILIAVGEPASTGKQIGSRENPGNEPVLTIEYTVAPEPTPPLISGTTLDGNEIRFSFIAEQDLTYAVEFRGTLAGGDWSVLTNIPAQPAETLIQISDAVSSPERYYRIRTP
jgi:hypothetical protein